MDHSERAAKHLRPLLVPAVILLGAAVVGLHIVGGLMLLKAGLSSFALPGLLAYVVVGLFVAVAIIKLTHVVRMGHRKRKGERAR